MALLTIKKAVTVTLRLPRHSWPKELMPLAHPSQATISLLRGRLTGREAILVIRLEGSTHEVQDALLYWEGCGFAVEKDGHHRIQNSERGPRTRIKPSLQGRGSPVRGSRDLLS